MSYTPDWIFVNDPDKIDRADKKEDGAIELVGKSERPKRLFDSSKNHICVSIDTLGNRKIVVTLDPSFWFWYNCKDRYSDALFIDGFCLHKGDLLEEKCNVIAVELRRMIV